MSSGEFVSTKYELDSANGGLVVRARVQQETINAAIGTNTNAAPAGSVDLAISARSAKGRREFGIRMRYVTIELLGDPPDNYTGQNLKIPVLTPATFAAWAPDATVNYLGTTWKILKKFPEDLA